MKNSALVRASLVTAMASVAIPARLPAASPQAPVAQMRGDGPAPVPKPFNITRVDPGLDEIIAPSVTAEVMASGFGINEGVLWIREGNRGYVLVSSLIDNVIYKITPDHRVSVFMEKAGYSGDDPSRVGLQTRAGRTHVLIIGPNCASLDALGPGRVVCRAGSHGQAARERWNADRSRRGIRGQTLQRSERHRHQIRRLDLHHR